MQNEVCAVIGLISRADKLLISKRPEGKPYSGYWEFPGGKIEENEDSYTALKRELFEELGIKVLNAENCFQHQHDYPDKRVNLEIWHVKHFLGEPFGSEGQLIRWAALDELVDLPLLEGNLGFAERLKIYLHQAKGN